MWRKDWRRARRDDRKIIREVIRISQQEIMVCWMREQVVKPGRSEKIEEIFRR